MRWNCGESLPGGVVQQGAEADKVRDGARVRGPQSGFKKTIWRSRLGALLRTTRAAPAVNRRTRAGAVPSAVRTSKLNSRSAGTAVLNDPFMWEKRQPNNEVQPLAAERSVRRTESVQRHIGRVLRSSCNSRGRRLTSSRGGKPRPGRCSPFWPGDVRFALRKPMKTTQARGDPPSVTKPSRSARRVSYRGRGVGAGVGAGVGLG